MVENFNLNNLKIEKKPEVVNNFDKDVYSLKDSDNHFLDDEKKMKEILETSEEILSKIENSGLSDFDESYVEGALERIDDINDLVEPNSWKSKKINIIKKVLLNIKRNILINNSINNANNDGRKILLEKKEELINKSFDLIEEYKKIDPFEGAEEKRVA